MISHSPAVSNFFVAMDPAQIQGGPLLFTFIVPFSEIEHALQSLEYRVCFIVFKTEMDKIHMVKQKCCERSWTKIAVSIPIR